MRFPFTPLALARLTFFITLGFINEENPSQRMPSAAIYYDQSGCPYECKMPSLLKFKIGYVYALAESTVDTTPIHFNGDCRPKWAVGNK